MEIQLWRNATVLLTIKNTKFLIDPMLGEKSSFGKFPWVKDERLNPLVDLPFDSEELDRHLAEIDAVVVSHLHPDHWDVSAVELLDKNVPIICPSIITKEVEQYGFTNVQSLENSLMFEEVSITITNGLHGRGEIGEKMGAVNGFVFSNNEESIYFAGDTIWCDVVKSSIEKHNPQHVVVAGGAATFAIGDPVIMTSEDIISLCKCFPQVNVVVTHLEAITPCVESREFISEKILENGLSDRCTIPEDGEVMAFEK